MMPVPLMIIASFIIVSAAIPSVVVPTRVMAVSTGAMPDLVTAGSTTTDLAAVARLLISGAAVTGLSIGSDGRAKHNERNRGRHKSCDHVTLL